VAWTDFERGVEARSGHGCPAIYEVGQSDAAETSAAAPRWGAASVPARNRPRQPACRQAGTRALWSEKAAGALRTYFSLQYPDFYL